MWMLFCFIIVSLSGALLAAMITVLTPANASPDLRSLMVGLSVWVSVIFLTFVTRSIERLPWMVEYTEAWRVEFQTRFKAAERIRVDE
jgi:hypothetical protein